MSPKLSKTLVLTAAFACLLTAVGVSAETTAGNGATGAGSSGDHTEMDADSSASSAFPPNGTGVEGSEERDHCPGYRPGNPQQSEETENCAAGAGIGVVDHMQAFGMGSHVRSPNWTACGIPVLPNENERVCYKTSVFQCPDGYQIYLNQRNLRTLQSSCANETDVAPVSPSGGLFLQSPRYGCRSNDENSLFKYRKSEFCLYDLSLPGCTSGRVVIDNDLHFTQEMERRQRYHICSDYLQFFTDTTASKRYCDSELSRIKLEIPSTRFTALFWTDISFNRLGFKLHVSCADP